MSYTPRLTDAGIVNNFHWYSQNPFYIAGYGMPNCTCYAWGRFWEIGDVNSTGEHKPNELPTGDGRCMVGTCCCIRLLSNRTNTTIRKCNMFL